MTTNVRDTIMDEVWNKIRLVVWHESCEAVAPHTLYSLLGSTVKDVFSKKIKTSIILEIKKTNQDYTKNS